MINVLITAGGTSEPIDSVRSITNKGTGRLGSLIADAFAKEEAVDRIFYVCTRNAVCPRAKRVSCIEIETVADLQKTVTELLATYPIEAIVHSMAVSDYTVKAVSTTENVAAFLWDRDRAYTGNNILNAMEETDVREKTEKISSSLQAPLLLLERTPKILPLFRKTVPEAIIVGFKLLSKVTKDELIDTGYRLLVENGCDHVFANDISDIDGERHEGYLIDANKNTQSFQTKREIADGIVTMVLREIQRKI